MIIRGQTITARMIALAVGIVLIVGLVIYVPGCIRKDRSQAAQARLDAEQGKAAVASGKDASEAQAAVNRNEVASEALGRANEKEIRSAEGSNAVVAAPAHNAGLLALCRRKVNRDREQCRMLNAR